MSVRLEVLSSDGEVVAKAHFKEGSKLRFVVDSEARVGHLRQPADQLGSVLGVPVEYVVRPKHQDAPVGEPDMKREIRKIEHEVAQAPSVKSTVFYKPSSSRPRA